MVGTKRRSKRASSDESPPKRGRSGGGAALNDYDGNAERTRSDPDEVEAPSLHDEEHDEGDYEEHDEGDYEEHDEGDASPSRHHGENDEDEAEAPTEETPSAHAGDEQDEAPRRQEETDQAEAPIASPMRALNTPGKPPEAGVIKRVYVENFMCHPKLTVDLCRNVNFIHGQNGSGKSAILAAIQICLGAGARRTNRARNLKELIRKETSSGSSPSSAKIRVTVLNDSSDGYKPDVYGKEITIERVITLNGGFNGYKLLDAEGSEKSRDKKELDEMLDFLNIQVENPVAVLDQEEAKKFLMGKPQDKYKFFLKASELERVDRVYGATSDVLKDLTNAHDRAHQSIQTGWKHVETLKKAVDEHKKLGELEMKAQMMTVKIAWAVWREENAKHEDAASVLEACKEKIASKEEDLRLAEEAANGGTEEQDKKMKLVRDLSSEAGEQAEKKKKLEAELKAHLVPMRARQQDVKSIKNKQKQNSKHVSLAKKQLEDMRQEILRKAGSRESEEAQRTKLLQTSEAELAQLKEKTSELKQTHSDATRAAEETESRLTAAKNEEKDAKGQLSQVQMNLRNLEASGNNSMALFGGKVAKLHRAVDEAKRQGRFRGAVEGPIGSYLKVAPGKELYKDVAETILGNQVLDRFIVTNDHDRKALNALRRQAGCKNECGIFQVRQGRRYNVPAPPVDGIETMATALSIENDLVFNCLVDQQKIEKVALGRTKQESQDRLLIKDQQSGRSAIRGGKIHICYFLPRGDSWSVKGGQLSVLSSDRKARGLLSKDMGQAIEAAKAEEQQCRAVFRDAQRKVDRLEGEHTEKHKSWNAATRARQHNEKRMESLIDRINNIKEEIENEAPDAAIDTSVQEEEVQQYEEEEEKLARDFETAQADVEKMRPKVEELRSEIDDLSTRHAKVLDELQAAETDMTQYLETQSQKEDALQKKRDKVQKYKQKQDEQEERVAKFAKEVASHMRRARELHFNLKFCEERRKSNAGDTSVDATMEPTDEELEAIEPPALEKESKYYETRLKKLKERVENERERSGRFDQTEEQAVEEYQEAQSKFKEKADACANMEEKKLALEKDLRERKKRWRQFRTILKRETAIKFTDLLHMNNYNGDLEFDDDTESLDLRVSKGGTAQSQTKDVKALSGGERSYTTMCLLLAMGESLETPFRILDEFDVFLDPQVRKLTIQSLIHVAKRMEHRQFIFITPQDLTGIKTDPRLKIFKLKAPERHSQFAGGLTQQTL